MLDMDKEVLQMGLPGCLWFCHLSGKNKLACTTLLNALGFATDFFQVTGKWVTCPRDLQTPPLFQGKAISRASGQGKEQCIHREHRPGPISASHSLIPSFLTTILLSIGPKCAG